MDTSAFNRTARISKQFKVITKPASGAYRTDLAKAAVKGLKKQGLDVFGKSYKPITVTLKPGGK
jgi:NitT/TauT family transport system substrate-binding protein